MCVFLYVRMHICIYVRMNVCLRIYLYSYIYIRNRSKATLKYCPSVRLYARAILTDIKTKCVIKGGRNGWT